MLAWNDPSLRAASDNKRIAKYRALQSWWRETHLQVPPGNDQGGTVRGNFIPKSEYEKNPGLNFLDPSVSDYAHQRAQVVKQEHGTIDEDRLYRNLLSSMPMCFNLFGFFRNHLEAGAIRETGYDLGHVLVVAMQDDHHVVKAMDGFSKMHQDIDQLVRSITLEAIVSAAATLPELSSWATKFNQRYLDLKPVLSL